MPHHTHPARTHATQALLLGWRVAIPTLPAAAVWRAEDNNGHQWRVLCTGCGTQLRCYWLPRAVDEACRRDVRAFLRPLPLKEQGYGHASPDPFLVLHDDGEEQEQAAQADVHPGAAAAVAATAATKAAGTVLVVVAGDDWEVQLHAALEARSNRGGPYAALRIVVGEHNLSSSRKMNCAGLRSASGSRRAAPGRGSLPGAASGRG